MRILRRLRWDLRRRRALGLGLVLAGAGIIAAASALALRVTPTLAELALATATDDITIAVNGTVAELMEDGELDYSDLVTLERDDSGGVAALVANSARINLLQSRITNAVVEKFADTDITRVSIPLGNLIGGALLSGRGPRIRLNVLSITNVVSRFRNEFTSAGINQTRHRIILEVEVTLEVLLDRDAGTDSVVTEINVAETVIVGSVPDAYASLP